MWPRFSLGPGEALTGVPLQALILALSSPTCGDEPPGQGHGIDVGREVIRHTLVSTELESFPEF